ncbi:hypothetical protein BHE74_00032997 [Ensete ventricosum]|nr:hypothetical protein BHE74_00032997 [Ensete ventricosum]
MVGCHGRLPGEGASEKEEPTVEVAAVAIEGEGCDCVAAAVVAVGRKKRQRSDCRLEGAEPEIRSGDSSRRQQRVMGANGCSALLLWLKGTLGCEEAPRVAVEEEALAVGREVGGGVGCVVI